MNIIFNCILNKLVKTCNANYLNTSSVFKQVMVIYIAQDTLAYKCLVVYLSIQRLFKRDNA